MIGVAAVCRSAPTPDKGGGQSEPNSHPPKRTLPLSSLFCSQPRWQRTLSSVSPVPAEDFHFPWLSRRSRRANSIYRLDFKKKLQPGSLQKRSATLSWLTAGGRQGQFIRAPIGGVFEVEKTFVGSDTVAASWVGVRGGGWGVMDVILQSESGFIVSRSSPYKRARLEKEMGFSSFAPDDLLRSYSL